MLLGVLALSVPASAQATSAESTSAVSQNARVALELGGALLGTIGTLVLTESFALSMQERPIFQLDDGSLRIDPFTASGAYFALIDPFVVSTAVSLTGDALGHRGSYLGSLIGAIVGMASAFVLTGAVVLAAQSFDPAAPVLNVTTVVFPVLGSVIGFEL